MFRGEGYIDSHMDKAHGNETHPGARACMADLCDYLHCDFFKAAKKGSTQSLRSAQCHPGTMQERKARCQDVAHACFPPHAGGTAEVLHGFMLSTLCEAATCRWQLCVLRSLMECQRLAGLSELLASTCCFFRDWRSTCRSSRSATPADRLQCENCLAGVCRREELLGPLAKNPHAEAYMRTVRLLVVAFVCVAIYFAVLVQWSSRNKARELDLMGRARALWTGQKRGGRKLH